MKTVLSGNTQETIPTVLPVIPIMDVVVFPHMIVPLLVIDKKIIEGINRALEESKMVILLAAKGFIKNLDTITTEDLHNVGTVASIMRIIKIPEGGIKILVQGICRAKINKIITNSNNLQATIERIDYPLKQNDKAIEAAIRTLKTTAESLSGIGDVFSSDFHIILSKMHDPDKIIDFVLSHVTISVNQAQELLEKQTQEEVLEKLNNYLVQEKEMEEVQEKVKKNARESMNNAQKEFYLREQLRAIKKELGEDDTDEISIMYQNLAQMNASEEIKKDVKRQINRLERTAPESMEAAVTRNHLEWIFALPWGIETKENLDIEHAKKILDQDHYGLKDVKERILDFISICNLKKMAKNTDSPPPMLCLIGPPGTGKTSLGKSIAVSLGRKYARLSLGGVKDEAEIRGHRRTYVGAMPGRFIQAIRKAQSMNPIIVIDELDKIGSDFRGDPSAAMLEVLDPQQNSSFYDNYLGIPFDLSKVMFVATANTIDAISAPLRDRLEIIRLSGYVMDEKLQIARQYLVQKSMNDSGLSNQMFTVSESVLKTIITDYTRESGVRQLERTIRILCSKAARSIVEKEKSIAFTNKNIELYLGPRKFIDEEGLSKDYIGIINGLAWTPYGGEIIKIETVLMPGKGKLIITGQLGNVMQESAQAALSYARVHAKKFGISQKLFTQCDIHLHIPAAAIPKDGPSAGITILTSILSLLTQQPISSQYALTGELNLRGEIMPVGGVKEKIMAAQRNKIPYVILPYKNKYDLAGIEDLVKGVKIILVKYVDEVFKYVLLSPVSSKKIKQPKLKRL